MKKIIAMVFSIVMVIMTTPCFAAGGGRGGGGFGGGISLGSGFHSSGSGFYTGNNYSGGYGGRSIFIFAPGNGFYNPYTGEINLLNILLIMLLAILIIYFAYYIFSKNYYMSPYDGLALYKTNGVITRYARVEQNGIYKRKIDEDDVEFIDMREQCMDSPMVVWFEDDNNNRVDMKVLFKFRVNLQGTEEQNLKALNRIDTKSVAEQVMDTFVRIGKTYVGMIFTILNEKNENEKEYSMEAFAQLFQSEFDKYMIEILDLQFVDVRLSKV